MSLEELESLKLPPEVVLNVLKSGNKEATEHVLNYLLFRGEEEGDFQCMDSLFDSLLSIAECHEDVKGLNALKILINASGSEANAKRILGSDPTFGKRLLKLALNRQSKFGNEASKLLSNLSRHSDSANEIVPQLSGEYGIKELADAICDKSYNTNGSKLEYLCLVFGNLCQSGDFRKQILDPELELLSKVLPVINNGVCDVERRGVASAVYNCLFDPATHETLMGSPHDILPILLLPLAGPEEFDMDDYDKLPIELQYLPEDKEREEDPTTRNILLRSLLHLCSRRKNRKIVRDSNTYLILREYHKWEEDRQNLLAVENVIDLLIRTEDEIGVDDVSQLEVPEDLIEKFEKMDKDFLED